MNKYILLCSLLLCLQLCPFVKCSRKFQMEFLQDRPTPGTGPYFDTSVPQNYTGLVGQPISLLCKVKNLGNRTVSWVRHRDIHLLTVGRYTYTSDQRFETKHSPHSEDWLLYIRYPQKHDTGVYECQISSTPPIGHKVYLDVVEPTTEIAGEPDVFINRGSIINLLCEIRYAPQPPPHVTWSHEGTVINYDSPRGGISSVTEKGIFTTSRLLIQQAIGSDSGVYSCTPSNAPNATIRVHVVDAGLPAAVQSLAVQKLQSYTILSICCILSIIKLMLKK